MADSARLALLKAMRDRLAAITVDGGYHFDWQHVSLDPGVNPLTAVPPGVTPWALIEPTPDGQRTYFPADEVLVLFRGVITVRHDVPDALDALGRVTVWEQLIADIERAVVEDVSFGGLCIDTRLSEPQPIVGIGSPMVLVVQPWEIRLRRTYGQP